MTGKDWRNDADELRRVASVMAAFEARCEEIMTLLGEKRYLKPAERQEIEAKYRSLKGDLKSLAKHGTTDTDRREKTEVEQFFFDSAVRRAAIDLRPATNSNPISSRWFSAVHEAQMEFSYYRHNLEGALKEAE